MLNHVRSLPGRVRRAVVILAQDSWWRRAAHDPRARAAGCGSEGFLDTEVEAAGPFFAPAPRGGKVRPRPLVQENAKADAGRRRVVLEQLRAGLDAADRRRVDERDEADQAARDERAPILDLAVHQVLAAISSLAVAAARSHVAARCRQVQEG